MIDFTDESIEWTERANDQMGLLTMIDELYKVNICKFEEPFLKHEPRDIEEKSFKDCLLFNTFYNRHSTLLINIVEVFFPKFMVFVPSKINKKGTSEFFLFYVIHEIYCITWYQEIEKSRPRGYEKETKKLDKALDIVRGYVDGNVGKLIRFPKHQNEILLSLSETLKKCRPNQEKKIIKLIKDYFEIKSLKDTKHISMIKANRELVKFLGKEGIPLFKTNF